MITPNATSACVTADELLHLPDDGYRYELIRGHLVRDSPAGFHHGTIAGNLHSLLWVWARRTQAGTVCAAETGFRLGADPDTVRAPDVAFVAHSRLAGGTHQEGFFEGPPDLAVEVLSPNDRMLDVLDKVRDFLDAGAQQVWVVAPGPDTVTIYQPSQDMHVYAVDDALVGDGPVAGFRCAVREIFA